MFLFNRKFIKLSKFHFSSLFSLTSSFLFITFIMFLSPNIVHCFDRSFAWDANTEPDLAGYNIYYKDGNSGTPYDGTGADEGNSPIQIPIASLNDPENPEYTIHGLSDTETYFFVITAYDIFGNESDFSNELLFQPSLPRSPAPGTDIIDNDDPGTSSTGSWPLSIGANYYGTQSSTVQL